MSKKQIHILGGGTVFHVRNHLALCAPAYGSTARLLEKIIKQRQETMDVNMHLTKMADPSSAMETNEDVDHKLQTIVADPLTKIVFMNVAMCDAVGMLTQWEGYDSFAEQETGKYAGRLNSKELGAFGYPSNFQIQLGTAEKIIPKIRRDRKDIFLVAFKTTCGVDEQEQYQAGLRLLKEASCNLVLVNDTKTRLNMIVTPEEARYCVTTDRERVLGELVEMSLLRSHLTFTQSTVVAGDPVSWHDERIPASLRTVVDHCIKRGAYKAFNGSTVGHFACKLDDQTFLTSIRRSNFNDLEKMGLVLVKTDGPDTVLAFGAKPSVGGQSQRIVFNDHPGMDCIVHFHCPKRPTSSVPVASQREFECGSHQCGKNTSDNLEQYLDIDAYDAGGNADINTFKAVYLDQHGPNIVFNSAIDPHTIIAFIEKNFDLEGHTGGYVPASFSPYGRDNNIARLNDADLKLLQGPPKELKALVHVNIEESPLQKIMGKWPGDESDEEILDALEKMS